MIACMLDAEGMRARAAAAARAWDDKDFDAYYSFFDPAVVYHGPGGVELHGVDALRSRYDEALAYCPDLTIVTKLVVADADTCRLASVQDEAGTSVDGKPFRFESMTFFHFNDAGLVDEVWEQFEIRS